MEPVMTDAPLIKLCELWERRRRGNTEGQPYLAGAIGGLKLLIFKRHDPGDDGPHWSVFVTARSERRDQPTRGQATNEAARENAESWSPQRRTAYAEKLVSEFQPDDEPFA
jgi:hypothetical protein